ncbi:MAG: hypothetical protein ACLSHU_14030 [Oscillospiraceae bacterium]
MVAVSEGIHYRRRHLRLEAKTSATDGFGHAQLGGSGCHDWPMRSSEQPPAPRCAALN